MSRMKATIQFLHSPRAADLFFQLYGDDKDVLKKQASRYERLVEEFVSHFSDGDIFLFSTPGRTEIGGNHTDHNHGRVLAASVDLDSIAAAARTDDSTVTVYSEGYAEPFRVRLDDLARKQEEVGSTSALLRGIASGLVEKGYSVGGFNACVMSDVLVGSGLSSSASVEVLIGTVFNVLFNGGKIPAKTIAKIGQYAENVYFGKPCGLMDQTTCAVGGIVTIDFQKPEEPVVEKIDFDFGVKNYRLLVVDTGGNHADLTEDYAAVPREMKSVAEKLGGRVLRDVEESAVLNRIGGLRTAVGDRALLRALHFFEDNERVLEQVDALRGGRFDRFLALVNASGNSSFKWLQNCYTTKNTSEQGVSLALALTEKYIEKVGEGACRVHGGGFAGTIQVFLPVGHLEGYVTIMEGVFGEGSVRVLRIRPTGTICLYGTE
ncbi:MAG: galactokinase family protein [bacterium]